MFKFFKPYLGPTALICLEKGMNAAGFPLTDFWAGAMIAFAVFWFFFAMTSHSELLRRFPRIKEWLPFIDPAGGIMANPKELTGKFISGQTFKISDLAYNGRISGRHFENCVVHGPAVLMMSGIGHVIDCKFHGEADEFFITTQQDRFVGPIELNDCTFKNCEFPGIGLIGPKEAKAKFAGTRKNL